MNNPFYRNTKTEKHFGGGPRPCWIGEPFKAKVTSLEGRFVTLEVPANEADPMDIQVGNEYVVVFNPVPSDSSSPAPES